MILRWQGHFVAPKINDIIIGGAYNGLFGTTISCVGDLNKDEFHGKLK